MRLLNTTTLEVENFASDALPKYAILSHRWIDEVSFQDIQQGTARTKRGFGKLERSCSIAREKDLLPYIWVDTCCIDKSSSAELSEAINSMFRYYRYAEICLAYLQDASGASDFLESDWFNRGWTLQELVAPREVRFYDGRWACFGDRTSLSESISTRTGIAQVYLLGRGLTLASIAERMSWAATRNTTRPEDIAYCLLGIFDIRMPLLYGEGAEKAFIRLQRELLKETTDESWLAWGALPGKSKAEQATAEADSNVLHGMLAKSPAYFWNCRDVVVCHTSAKTPISTSSMGIHVDVPEVSQPGNQILLLGCRWRHDYQNVIGISVSCRMGRYYRASMDTVVEPETKWTQAVRGDVKILGVNRYQEPENPMDSLYVIEGIDPCFRLAEVFPPAAWEPSPTHIRARMIGGEPRLPLRLLRLEHVCEAGGRDDPVDYILRLDGIIAENTWQPSYEIGMIPKNVQLADAEQLGIHFGQAVVVSGEQGALSVELKITAAFMTDICAVEVYMDMTGVEDELSDDTAPAPAAHSQVLAMRPGDVERSKQEHIEAQRQQQSIRAAEKRRACLEESQQVRRAQEDEALWVARDESLRRRYWRMAIISYVGACLVAAACVEFKAMWWPLIAWIAITFSFLFAFFLFLWFLFAHVFGDSEQRYLRGLREVHRSFQRRQTSHPDTFQLEEI